ncbi:DUF2510 domain-containing protein [Mycolicibacterium moriokaense]|uniref:DUF2510 domain-containing protein n=1 Tax=Mycolicibacterium moriokaense TaxID=39691 RepID=UPI0015E8D34A
MTSPLPPPGWYPDPGGGPAQRFFDGHRWTEDQARPCAMPPPPYDPQPPVARRNGLDTASLVTGLVAFLPLCRRAKIGPPNFQTRGSDGSNSTRAQASDQPKQSAADGKPVSAHGLATHALPTSKLT